MSKNWGYPVALKISIAMKKYDHEPLPILDALQKITNSLLVNLSYSH